MVFDIRPTYYAAGRYRADITLNGFNFGLIPSDAIGILSDDNDRPLMHRNTQRPSEMVDISQIGAYRMTLTQAEEHTHANRMYLGAILSADRQTVYWENTTRPLPIT